MNYFIKYLPQLKITSDTKQIIGIKYRNLRVQIKDKNCSFLNVSLQIDRLHHLYLLRCFPQEIFAVLYLL